jgi:hypothetical protein
MEVAVESECLMRSSPWLKFTLIVACVLGFLASSIPAQAYLAPSSFFDVFLETSQGPPYPATNAVQANISVATAPSVPLETMSMRLNGMSPGAPTRLVGSDLGGGVGTPGVCSFFDVWMDIPLTVSNFFDVWLEMALPGGGAGLPLADTPTVVWHTDSFFDIYYELNVPGQGEQYLKLEFRVPEGQSVKFVGPSVQYPTVQSFFDVFLPVTPTGQGSSNPNLPLYRVIVTGSLGFPPARTIANDLTKFKQNPDTSARGLDVLAGPYTNLATATMLADDFICTQTGPISDIHIWGSWRDDRVDQRAIFWLGLWSDVPRAGNVASHPGVLLWSQQFNPGRYRNGLAQTVAFEQFYNPNPPAGVIGQDRQIWKYDFFPQTPFVQTGSPNTPTNYWLSVIVSNAPDKVFGWKTTPDHYNDYAVFAPAQLALPFPPLTYSWQTLTALGRNRELSFTITTSQQWACNKTFYRPSLYYYNTRVILPGIWPISSSFDGGGAFPLFGGFGWDWNADNNTVLDWSQAPGSGDWVHVGVEGLGPFPPFVSWGWWDPYGYQWFGWVPQVNIGLPVVWQPTPWIGITNILPIVPGITNNVMVTGLQIEYYTDPVPLAQLNSGGSRAPMRAPDVVTVEQPAMGIAPGSSVSVQIPSPPAGANYAVLIPQISPMMELGQPDVGHASTDWAMYPLTSQEAPAPPAQPQIQSSLVTATNVTLTWTAVPGAIYRVQSKGAISNLSWTDEEGDVIAGEATASKAVSLGGNTSFYRVIGFRP